MKQFVHSSDVKVGDILELDDGFECMKGTREVFKDELSKRLYVTCTEGKHFLDGQFDFDGNGTYVGLYKNDKYTT